MTLLEAIVSNPLFCDIPKEEIEPLLTLRGLDGEGAFTPSKTRELELVSADLYVSLALGPDYSEGSLSVKYDRNILLTRAKGIYGKYDDPKSGELKGSVHVSVSSLKEVW